MDNSGDNNTVTDTNFENSKLVNESPVTITLDEEASTSDSTPASDSTPTSAPAATPAPTTTPASDSTPTPAPETPAKEETTPTVDTAAPISPAPISKNSISSNSNTQVQKDNNKLYSIILFAAAGFLIVFALIGLIASIAKIALIICFILAVACGTVAYVLNKNTKNTKKTSAEMSFKPTAADDQNIAPDFATITAKPEPTNTYVTISPFTVIKYPEGRDVAEEEAVADTDNATDVTLPDEKKEEPKTQTLSGAEAYKALTPDMISGIEFGLNAISAAIPENLKSIINSISFKLTETGNLESNIKSIALSESDKQSVLNFLETQLKATTTNPDFSFDKAYGVDLDLKLYNDTNWSINYK